MTNPPTPSPEPPRHADDGTYATSLPQAPDRAIGEASRASAELSDLEGDATFQRVIEPASKNRLPLESGVWHQVSKRYLAVQLIGDLIGIVVIVAAAVVLWFLLSQPWVWFAAGGLLLLSLLSLALLPRRLRSIAFQVRDDDLVFRKGILWQRIVAVPYGRMQLIDINTGPVDRLVGIAQLKLVTAAAATGVTIPGLSQQVAERLRDQLVELAESRRTGL